MILLGFLTGFAIAAARFQAGPSDSSTSAEDYNFELMLVDASYGPLRLDVELPALQNGKGRMYVPLRQLSSGLGFRIHVDPEKRLATGFLGDPSDRIVIDGVLGRCERFGLKTTFDPRLCFARDHDLYFDADLLARLAGLHFKWLLNQLELVVTSDKPLRVKQLWMMRNMLDSRGPPEPSAPLPSVKIPFSFLSIPSLDVSLYTDTAVGEKATVQSTSRMQVEGSGDLAYLTAHYRYVTASDGQPPTPLLSLGRQDLHAGLLGSLRATQFSFGDLSLPQHALLPRSDNGLGLSVSNFPVAGSVTGKNSIEGYAPPRSSVEVYRRTELLDMVRADDRGHYMFATLPLESGANDLRIVQLTPDGDVREERRTVYGASSGPAVGEGRYRFTAARVGDSIVPHALDGIAAGQSGSLTIGEYQWGLNPSTWLSATGTNWNGQSIMGLGINSWALRSLVRFESMISGSGGAAFSTGISKRFGRTSVSFDQILAARSIGSGLAPEVSADATSISRLRLDGSTGNRACPIGYGLSVDRGDGSDPTTLTRALVNFRHGDTFYANTLATRLSHDPCDTTGVMQIGRSFGSALGRLDLGYGFGHEKLLQAVQVSLDEHIRASYRMRFGLEYDPTRVAPFETSAALYRNIGPVDLGLNLTADTHGSIRCNLLFAIGIGGGQSAKELVVAPPGATSAGNVSVKVFLDRNMDGKFDAGDTWLPDVGVKVDGRAQTVKSGHDGVCFLNNLPSNEEVSVALNDDTFENPSWVPETPGVMVTPRTGHVVHLELGVIESAEISGKALGAASLPDGLTAQLVDSTGKVAQISVIEEDEVYVFSQVRPGDYTLKLVNNDGRFFGSRSVTVPPGAMMKNVDVNVVPPKGEPVQMMDAATIPK